MNAMFGTLTTDGLEEAEDRIGGGFQPFESDAYEAEIKAMYAGQSQGGAHSMTVIADIGGKEHRETIYFTNRKGENFFLNKDDKTKKVPLPGFTTVDHLCLVATGSPLSECEFEDKVVQVYDYDAKREVPKTVPMLTAAIGSKVGLLLLKILENKSKKEGDEYVDTTDTREFNEIDKVFDIESRMTVVEAQNEVEEAIFVDSWIDRNKGQTRDKRTIKDGGDAGNSGRPGAAANKSAPAAGNGASKTKSLFGNKK